MAAASHHQANVNIQLSMFAPLLCVRAPSLPELGLQL